MRNRILFGVVALGIAAGFVSAYVYARPRRPVPPAFTPASNPYGRGIYANGIIESYQNSGANLNIYPEVTGTVVAVTVREGQSVGQGMPLFALDDSVQRAQVEQQVAAAAAARALLERLRAAPRKEDLAVARAQVVAAAANRRTASDQLRKQVSARAIDPRAVSQDVFDNAVNTVKVAQANLGVARRQYDQLRAGTWSYDIRNQERQTEALEKAAASSQALLDKYIVLAPADGIVLSVRTSAGSYVSPQGAYDTYTQGMGPAVVMATPRGVLGVRCYIDEILIRKLPPPSRMRAKMFLRGTSISVPLEFMRVQPYVSPKIELSNERLERVDLRVLPVIFRFVPPRGIELYPGELVDVYVGQGQS